MKRSAWLLGVLVATLLGGCGSGSADPASRPAAETTSTPSATSSATPSTTPSSASFTGISKRCNGPQVPARRLTLRSRTGDVLDGAVVGSGPDVAVFVHETGSLGFCGFWPFVGLTRSMGFRSVLIDLCSYAEASCKLRTAFDADQVAQVRLAVQWARRHGARRVTLVGASMGGAVATGSAGPVGADALVDLSGPLTWLRIDDRVAFRSLRVPILAAVTPGDSDVSDADLAAAVASAPTMHKEFVRTPTGHGWELLTDTNGTSLTSLARKVVDLVLGR